MANPYETLGVAPDASQDAIRKAYRKAAKETHPDLNPGKPEAEKRFKEINAAYDIVGDADKRKRYDAGEIDETGAERQPERHFYREYAEADPHTRYSRRGASAGERRDDGADVDYDVFADLFRGRAEGGNFRMPPQDVRYALAIDFLDAVNGAHKVVAMPDGKTGRPGTWTGFGWKTADSMFTLGPAWDQPSGSPHRPWRTASWSSTASIRSPRLGKGSPSCRCSRSFHPAPTPTSIRPPLISSAVVTILANVPACRNVTGETSAPNASRSVSRASPAITVQASVVGWPVAPGKLA